MNEEKLAAYYIGLHFLKELEGSSTFEWKPFDAHTLRSIVHGKLGKKVAYVWMENMYENNKFLFKKIGGNAVSSWGKVAAACSEPVFKANMLALADNVVILEGQCKSMKAINPDLKWGSRGTSIRLTLEALVLKTKMGKSFQSLISVGDVMFSVFFQLDVYKPPEKATIGIRLCINPEKNIIAKVQTVNNINTVEASITHALGLNYYLDKMNKAGVSFTHLKNLKISSSSPLSKNKSTQRKSQTVPNKVKANSVQQEAFSNVQTAYPNQVKANIADEMNLTESAQDDSVEIFVSDENLTDPITEDNASAQPVLQEDIHNETINEEKLAAYYIGLHFLKEFERVKNERVRFEVHELRSIVQERMGKKKTFNWMEKMFENHKYLFKNMGCNSFSKWGNITSSCSEPVFKVYMLALADNVVTFEGSKSTSNQKSVLKWGKRGTSIYLSNLKGVLQWPVTGNRKVLFVLISVENVIFSLPFQLEYSMITEQVSLEVRLFVNAQRNIIAKVQTVNGKETIEASIKHALSLKFYKEMRAKAGVPQGSLSTGINAKGFIITSNGDCSQANSQEVPVTQETYVLEPKDSHEDTDEIYVSDATPTDSIIEEHLVTDSVIDEDVPISTSVADNFTNEPVSTIISNTGVSVNTATILENVDHSESSSQDNTLNETITRDVNHTTTYVENITCTTKNVENGTPILADIANKPQTLTDVEIDSPTTMTLHDTPTGADALSKANHAISNLKLNYKENQWSPNNPTGKKVYCKDFLLSLQLAPNSMKRPVDFLYDIFKDKPRTDLSIPKLSLPSGYKLCMTWISHYTLQNLDNEMEFRARKGWSLEKIESESCSSYDNFLDGLPDQEIKRQSEKDMETSNQSIDYSHKSLPKNSTEGVSGQMNLLVSKEHCTETLHRDKTSQVKTNKDRERLKSSHYDQQLEHTVSVKQKGSQYLSPTKGLFGGWKTSSGEEMSMTQTTFECVDWKESSSTQKNGMKEVEVVIRGKVKLGTSQQLIAINDLLGNVIISTDESNK